MTEEPSSGDARSNAKTDEPDQLAAELEFHKGLHEYLKHLSTLSTGSIVLLAAFLEKIFTQPKWKILLAVSILGFIINVVSSVVIYSLLVLNSPGRNVHPEDWEQLTIASSIFITWLSFLLGVVSLAIFIIRNLF